MEIMKLLVIMNMKVMKTVQWVEITQKYVSLKNERTLIWKCVIGICYNLACGFTYYSSYTLLIRCSIALLQFPILLSFPYCNKCCWLFSPLRMAHASGSFPFPTHL